MKRILALLLSMILAGNLAAQSSPPADPRTAVTSMAVGAKLKIKMREGAVIRGRLSSVSQDDFTILTGRANATSRIIRFSDVSSVIEERHSHTPVVAWIAAGAIVAVVVIVIAVVAIERHNEGG